MSTSIRRLAQLAGVSPVAVSRALRGRDGVSEATRNAILALARKYNYPLPRAEARPVSGLLNTLCSMINIDADDGRSREGFHRRLLDGVARGAADCGVELLNTLHKSDAWPLPVNREQVDGVVLPLGDESLPHPPFPAPVPTVFIFCGPPEADVVGVDNFNAGALLSEHLVGLGHRRVAYIGPRTSMSFTRMSGLRLAMELAGGAMPPEFVEIQPGIGARKETTEMTDGMLALRRTAARPDGFTALMCYNDHMAAQAVLRLRERGVRVPEDVSVVGFDNVHPDWYDGPALTTAAVPLEEIGAEAARLLYWRLAHPDAPPRRLVLNAPLVAGETTRTFTVA